MARPLRIEFEGALYHVTSRGNARQTIFHDVRDRKRFLERLGESVETYGVRLYLFCLMTNHLHLVVETPRGNLGRFMQSLLTSYAVYFNLRHGRAGHLTESRYGARLVEADAYLRRLSRYVHLNPVFAGRLKRLSLQERLAALRAYRWSSYRSYIGLDKPVKFVDYAPILAQASETPSARKGRYREFVEAGLAETDQEFLEVLSSSPRSIGGEAFRRWIDGLHAKLLRGRSHPEDVSFHRPARTVEPHEVLAAVSEELGIPGESLCRRTRGSMARPIAAHLLCKHAGTTQREAATILGLKTGAAVSVQLRTLRHALARQAKLRRLLAGIEARLEACGHAPTQR